MAAVENITVGHISEVEESLLRVCDVTHKTLKDLVGGGTKAEFKGLLDLMGFAWKVDKDVNVMTPKARLVARD